MRARSIIDKLVRHIRNPKTFQRPIWLWGPPGVGKSSIVRQVCRQLGMEMIDIRAVTLDPVDVRGCPYIVNDRTEWATPGFLPKPDCPPTLLFLDELAQAVGAVQSAFLQLTLDRRIGDYVLPDNVYVMAASNRQEDRAGANRVISPLLGRFGHIDFEVSNDDWQEWAMANHVSPVILSFLQWRPDQLMAFDAKSGAKAFPSPRSWEFASDELTLGLDVGVLQETLGGIVGPGAASEFCAFLEVWHKLPTVDSVFKAPQKAEVFTKPDMAIAMIGALVDKLAKDKGLADPYSQYVVRLSQEYAVLGIRNGIKVCQGVMTTPAATRFIAENKDLIV